MYVIVGLGNPGIRYRDTRHNMGFKAIDLLSIDESIDVSKVKHQALIGDGHIAGERVILAKPQTFMNLSGRSVREILAYYKLSAENLIVIYDDFDTPMGGIRIRKKGSAGSHNGMKSVIYDLQTDDFIRIRIGIGSASAQKWKKFVLTDFSKDEMPLICKGIEDAAAAVPYIIKNGVDSAMNRFNFKKKPENEGEQDE